MAPAKTTPRKKVAKATKGRSGAVKKASSKRSTTTKTPVKKAATKKTAAKKPPAKKAVAKKAASKGATANTGAAKQRPTKKSMGSKVAAGRPATGKAPVKKTAVKKTAPKKALVKKAPTKKPPVKEPTVKKAAAPVPVPRRAHPRTLKVGFKLEYYMNVSVASLYEQISTPSGLSHWFCDDVNVLGDRYTFYWSDESEKARLLAKKQDRFVQFQWEEDEEDDPAAFFELRIRVDGMTNDICLVVTDHSWPEDLDEDKALWDAQIQELTRILGG